MRWLIFLLLIIFAILQYALWFGDGGIAAQKELQENIAVQEQRNQELAQRNQEIAGEVEALRTDEGLEERARQELGLIGEGETFFMVIEDEIDPSPMELPAVSGEILEPTLIEAEPTQELVEPNNQNVE